MIKQRICTDEEKLFFSSLQERMVKLPENAKHEIKKHLDYLKKKCGEKYIESSINSQILDDAIYNINNVLNQYHDTYTLSELIKLSQQRLEGWCSDEKCKKIIEIVLKRKPEIGVEIGVFGGRSLIPAAAAMQENKFGIMYGIESWSNSVATEHHISDIHDNWWKNVDFIPIKRNFLEFISKYNLVEYIKILESPASQVSNIFQKIDYLHIDGSHSTLNAVEDVVLYVKKVTRGG